MACAAAPAAVPSVRPLVCVVDADAGTIVPADCATALVALAAAAAGGWTAAAAAGRTPPSLCEAAALGGAVVLKPAA